MIDQRTLKQFISVERATPTQLKKMDQYLFLNMFGSYDSKTLLFNKDSEAREIGKLYKMNVYKLTGNEKTIIYNALS